MKCDKAQSLMLDHLYGDLKPREQKALLQHVQACHTCAEEYEAHKATVSAFKQVDMEEPPPGLSRKIVATAADRIEQQEPLPAWNRWAWKPALATAAAAMLVIVFLINNPPAQKIAHVAARAPSPGDAQMLEKAAPPQKPHMAEPAQMVEEEDVSRYRKTTEDLRESRGSYKENNLRFDIAATDKVGGVASESHMAGLKRAKKIEERPLPISEATAALPVEMKDEFSVLRSMGWTDRDEVEGDSKVLPDSEGEELVAASVEVYSKVPQAQESQAPESPVVRSQAEETGKGKLAYLGADGALEISQARLEKAQNEYLAGNAYFGKGDFDRAVLNYQKVIALASGEELAAMSEYRLGRSYQELELFEQAISVYKEIIKKYPDFPERADVYMAVGECYLGLGNADEAIKNFEIVLDQFPDNREVAREKIGQAKLQQKVSGEEEEPPPDDKD